MTSNKNYVSNLQRNYYLRIGNTLKKVTKEEYIKKSGNKMSNIEKLRKSVYPTQYRDYILLKYPDNFPSNISGKYVPVDYILANIVKALWKKNIITYGWDCDGKYPCFISMNNETNTGKDVIVILKKLLGKNIKIFDFIKYPDKNPKPGKETRLWYEKMTKKYPNTYLITIYPHFISINFNGSMIDNFHKKLKVKIPNEKNALKGNRILYFLDNYKII